MNSHLHVTRGGGYVELRLHRPECRNALSRALLADLAAALTAAAADEARAAVIMTGAPPAFCAGLDLREVAASGPQHDNAPLLRVLEAIETLPQPVIAAVNGPAMAGGAALVTACDLALAAETATFGYPGIARGLVAPAVVARLARAVGERPARQLLLTGQSIAAARALELGLVSEVVPAADLLARARAWARRLAEHPRAALLDTKRLLNTLRAAPPQAATLPGQAVVHRPDKMK